VYLSFFEPNGKKTRPSHVILEQQSRRWRRNGHNSTGPLLILSTLLKLGKQHVWMQSRLRGHEGHSLYCGLWPIKCYQGSETNKSNCENWKKLAFDEFREDSLSTFIRSATTACSDLKFESDFLQTLRLLQSWLDATRNRS
jgi:hypothetical protein